MRVLQISNFYPPYWVGGYEQIAEWVASGLREHGHRVDVLTGRGPAFDARPEIHGELDLDLHDLATKYFGKGLSFGDGIRERLARHVFSGRNYRACRRVIHRVKPDLISFWNPAFVSFSPLLAARREGIPTVVHLSDTNANPFRNPHPPIARPGPRKLASLTVDAVLKLARPGQFVVPSEFLARKFVAAERIPERRIRVLHWPVEPTIGDAPPPGRRGLDHRRFLFVGTLIPEKGPDFLIAAFEEACRERADLSLTLAGGGSEDYVARLRRRAEGLPIRFLGRLDREAVTRAYVEHDVLVFPSIWDEPYAVVPLEAMAMGLVVIGSRAGGTPEAVTHEDRGLLVPPRDSAALAAAILRLAGDPPLAERLAHAGQTWARTARSFAGFLRELEEIYQGVADGFATPLSTAKCRGGG